MKNEIYRAPDIENGGGNLNKNHQGEFNEWSKKYNELYKKLNEALIRDKQLDNRFQKFWELQDIVNKKYYEILEKFNNALDNENVSDEEFLELSKKETELNLKLSKINNIIEKISEASKNNDPSKIFTEINEAEEELRNELE